MLRPLPWLLPSGHVLTEVGRDALQTTWQESPTERQITWHMLAHHNTTKKMRDSALALCKAGPAGPTFIAQPSP